MPDTDIASTAVPFDPFELKDVVSGNIRDPFPLIRELLRESPVHLGPIDLGEGVETWDPRWPPPVTVFGFDEVVQVLRDNETYSSMVYADVMGQVMGRTILEMDEPEHRGTRARRRQLPLQGARALGGGAGRPRRQRIGGQLRGSGSFGSRPRRHLQLPGPGHRPHPGPTPLRLPAVPALGDRDHERRGQLGAGRGRLVGSAGLLRGGHDRAPRLTRRRSHQRPGAGGHRRRAAERRGDLLVPSPVAPGRGRDDLPCLGQPAVRAAQRPGAAPGAVRGPLPVPAGVRGGGPLGASGHGDPAAGPAATRSWPG